jgi:hypothetical protein
MRLRTTVQEVIGRAEAITSACRAFAVAAFDAAMEAVMTDSGDVGRAVARAQVAVTHAMNEAVRVADMCFHAAWHQCHLDRQPPRARPCATPTPPCSTPPVRRSSSRPPVRRCYGATN